MNLQQILGPVTEIAIRNKHQHPPACTFTLPYWHLPDSTIILSPGDLASIGVKIEDLVGFDHTGRFVCKIDGPVPSNTSISERPDHVIFLTKLLRVDVLQDTGMGKTWYQAHFRRPGVHSAGSVDPPDFDLHLAISETEYEELREAKSDRFGLSIGWDPASRQRR